MKTASLPSRDLRVNSRRPVDTKLVNIALEDGQVVVSRDDDSKEKRSAHGLYRTLIHNMITGVSEGYEKKLELVGVGYRAEKKGDTLVLNLGYSHPIEMKDPEGITTEVPSQTDITVKGIDKAEVGNYAASSASTESRSLTRARVSGMPVK